jgi:ribose/xylose/arabinose/galactoside ABC-type transport system permease subunit
MRAVPAANWRCSRSPAWPLGGSSIFGGVGSVWRTVLGVLMLGMITNGFDLLAVQDYWQNIVRGALIIIAVAIGLVVERR